MKTARMVALSLLVILLLAVAPWVILTACLDVFGGVVDGQVIGKREAILLSGSDHWKHAFEVTYRYQPIGSGQVETGSHWVDPALFSRLQVGARARIRYSPWRLLRPVNPYGSALAESSWLSRLPRQSDDVQWVVDLAIAAAAAVLVYLAYSRKSRPLGLAAAAGGATAAAGLLLIGFVVFPLLFLAWRRSPGKGVGWVLLASVVLSTAVIAWRIPWPAPAPSNPRHDAAAAVRQLKVVTHLWSTPRASGQGLRQPFQLVDLEFTPVGARESVHAVDQVDVGSVAGLTVGATVPVAYPLSDPRAARITGGTRTYAENALTYLLGLTYGLGALLMLVGWPVVKLAEKVSAVFRGLTPGSSGDIDQQISRLPADDRRRKALEDLLRRRREADERRRSRGS